MIDGDLRYRTRGVQRSPCRSGGRSRAAVLPIAILVAAASPTLAHAQQNQVAPMARDSLAAASAMAPQDDPADSVETLDAPDTPPSMKPDLLVVPIPMSNPTLGAGLTVAGVLFYNPNGSSEPWVTGVGGMYTTNKSWGGAAFHSMSLAEDRFKVLLFGGYANVKIRFYGTGAAAGDRGVSVDLVDKGAMALAQGQYRVADDLYVGVRYQFLAVESRIKRPDPRFPDLDLPPFELDSRISGVGPAVTYDSRDNQFAPRSGMNVTLVGLFNLKELDSDFSYNKWQVAASGYIPATDSGTLALHGGLCAVSSGGPFYDLCMYGQGGDLRGYEMGRYRDRASWALQAEWRQKLSEKFGAVVFAGVGGIADDLGDLADGEVLPSVGAGLRYRASKETGINLRLDVAIGKDSSAVYFGVGEAF